MTSVNDANMIDSVFLYLYNYSASQDNCEVTAFRGSPRFVEGTAIEDRQAGSVTYYSRGYGTAFDGTTIEQVDSAWTPRGGIGVGAPGQTVTNLNATGAYRWDITQQVADSFNAGKNFFAVVLYDSTNNGGASHERWKPTPRESGAPGSWLPYVLIYSTTPTGMNSQIKSGLGSKIKSVIK